LHRTEDVLATLSMIRQYKLDVRTVTMGIDLQPCAAPDLATLCDRIHERLVHYSGRLRAVCREVEGRYGIPIVNRRIAVSPIGWLAAGQRTEGLLAIARTLDAVAVEVGVDLVGGFSALVQKGWTEAERRLIAALPEVLSTTERVCASVNVGTTAAGINMDAILALGHVLKETAERTRDHDGFGCAKLVIFANAPSDNPFMAGAFHGPGEPDCVINIGVSGPGVVKAAVEDLVTHSPTGPTLGEIADMIAVPGETDAETLAALIADEVAIGVINHKTTAVRVIPVPGKGAGDRAVFGGLFGETAILPDHAAGGSTPFVRHGGRISAPLSSLRN
jgi:uncharacterized protein (UPF0210 family)